MVDQQTVLLALIAVLVLVSAFQAFQLAELGGKVQVMGSGASRYANAPVQTGAQNAPAGGETQAQTMASSPMTGNTTVRGRA